MSISSRITVIGDVTRPGPRDFLGIPGFLGSRGPGKTRRTQRLSRGDGRPGARSRRDSCSDNSHPRNVLAARLRLHGLPFDPPIPRAPVPLSGRDGEPFRTPGTRDIAPRRAVARRFVRRRKSIVSRVTVARRSRHEAPSEFSNLQFLISYCARDSYVFLFAFQIRTSSWQRRLFCSMRPTPIS